MKKAIYISLFVFLSIFCLVLSIVSIVELVPKTEMLVFYLQNEDVQQSLPPYLSGATKSFVFEIVDILQSVFASSCFGYFAFKKMKGTE